VPRPCFFDGQLIGSDDLNAIVSYFRNQDAILSRLLGGFGILGGLKVDSPIGARDAGRARSLATGTIAALSPNPQIIAGTVITVSAGVAIDALGRKLTVCEPVSLNVQDLARQGTQGTLIADTCAKLIGPFCEDAGEQLVVTEFFLIAELVETPSRPAPRFSGGGACDPAPGCEFSRKLEEVRFSLVPCLPDSYQFTGCVEETGFSLPNVKLGQQANGDLCREEVFAFIDKVQGDLANLCCQRPAVALAKILLTREPGSLQGSLPGVPLYTIVSDGYPCRRPVFQSALFTKFFPNLLCPVV